MRRLAAIILIAAGFGFLADTASAQTVEELKRELAAKNAEIARLKGRVRQLEGGGAPSVHPMAQPIYAPPPGPGEEEMDRALEQTLVSQGALVLAPFTYELTPEFSWAHWDTVTNPTLEIGKDSSERGSAAARIPFLDDDALLANFLKRADRACTGKVRSE